MPNETPQFDSVTADPPGEPSVSFGSAPAPAGAASHTAQTTEAAPPKGNSGKRRIPHWLILLTVIGFWLSALATLSIFILSRQEERKAAAASAKQDGMDAEAERAGAVSAKFSAPTPMPQIYTDTAVGFEIGYPADWRQVHASNAVYLHDDAADSYDIPRPYRFGRVIITHEEASPLPVDEWFKSKFSNDPEAPVLKRAITNAHGVVLLETAAKDPENRLRYYFSANGHIISLSMNVTSLQFTNRNLEQLYPAIVNSLKVGSPS